MMEACNCILSISKLNATISAPECDTEKGSTMLATFGETIPCEYQTLVSAKMGTPPAFVMSLDDLSVLLNATDTQIQLDCAAFVALMWAVTTGGSRESKISLNVLAGSNHPWMLAAVYLGPVPDVYTVLMGAKCVSRGQWIYQVNVPGYSSRENMLYIGLSSTGAQIMTMEQWVVKASRAFNDWHMHNLAAHCSSYNADVLTSRILMCQQMSGKCPECILMLPRVCYHTALDRALAIDPSGDAKLLAIDSSGDAKLPIDYWTAIVLADAMNVQHAELDRTINSVYPTTEDSPPVVTLVKEPSVFLSRILSAPRWHEDVNDTVRISEKQYRSKGSRKETTNVHFVKKFRQNRNTLKFHRYKGKL